MALSAKQEALLLNSPLLDGCDPSAVRSFLQTLSPTTVLKGQMLSSLPGRKAALGFVLDGYLDYMNLNGVLYATLAPGDFFEAQSLFSQVRPLLPFPVRARTNCSLVLISQQAMTSAMEMDPVFTRNFISVLSDSAQRILCRLGQLTAASPSVALALYLLRSTDQREIRLVDGFAGLSRRLNISRATLYRAFAELEENQLVAHQEKKIQILNRDGLFQFAHQNSQLALPARRRY